MTAKVREVAFLTEPWSPRPPALFPARTVNVAVTKEHVEQGYWRRFRDPVSLAIREILAENACADLFWNSDSFAPRYHDDDAMIGIFVEVPPDEPSGRCVEYAMHLPLPVRATRAMWRLRCQGIDTFRDFTMRLQLPVMALATPA